MTKWTVLDIPRSDFKVARQRGARAGRRAHTALVSATQFRSAAFMPWRHPTTKRRFALFLDVGENFAAKERNKDVDHQPETSCHAHRETQSVCYQRRIDTEQC